MNAIVISKIYSLIFIMAGYILLGKISLYFTTMPEGMSVIWFPNALILSLFLLRPYKDWPIIALAVIPSEIIADYSRFLILHSFEFGLINLSESFLSAFLLRYFSSRYFSFNHIRFALLFILIALAVNPSLSAFAGAYIYHMHIAPQHDFIAFWRVWFFGDSLGILFLTPLIFGMSHYPKKFFIYEHFIETIFTYAITIALAVSLFSVRFLPSVLPTTPMVFILLTLWIVFRNGLNSGIFITLVISLIAIHFTILNQGPFSIFDPVENTIYLQEFIAAMATSTLFFGVLLRQVNDTNSLLVQSNTTLEALTQNLENEIAKKTSELRLANQKLTELATTDPLTHIHNRRYLEENAEILLAHAERYQSPVSLIMFDIDHFKNINDTYSHQTGDQVLICITKAVKKRLRKEDIFARIGGEEFVVLVSQSLDQTIRLARELKEAVASQTIPTEVGSIRCTISIGIAENTLPPYTLDTMMHRADQNLYVAKAEGRNCIRW